MLREPVEALDTINTRIRRDFAYLAESAGVRADIELIVYKVTMEDLGEPTVALRGDLTTAWPFPGYKTGLIAIPVEGHALDEATYEDVPPPLCEWDDRSWEAWPQWRRDLWHEVCHQYQDERLHKWDTNDGKRGHRVGWREAVFDMADAVGCRREVFYELMRSSDVPSG